MISEENIKDMKKRFIHIQIHMKTMSKVFQNKGLVMKVLGCLNCSWQPKVIAIYESKDPSSMNLAILFGKLQE